MNRIKFSLLIFFTSVWFVGHSQSISIGAKGGLSLTTLATTNSGTTTTPDWWSRYHIGLFANFSLGKFSIQPEVLYSRQGSREKDVSTGVDARINLEYVSVPVLFKWNLPKGFNVHAGPQMSIRASSNLELESGGAVASTDISDKIHQFDWAMCLGAEWQSPFKVLVGARYNIPINNISKSDNTTIHNQVIQLSVGYRLFTFGK